MKYSFMSFSTPEADADQLIEIAEKYGYDGVEPRAGSGHAHGLELESSGGFREEARKKFESSGIDISCIATSCKYADPLESAENVELTKKYIELAGDVGAPAVRVFGGLLPEGVSREDAVRRVSESLKEVSEAAGERSVSVCMETHDDWCDPAHVAAVIRSAAHPFIRVNWDIMHPVRRAGKTMDEAFDILRGLISHVHFHDGVTLPDGKSKLVPTGTGDIDHRRAVELLMKDSYKGYLSGEWIKWGPWEEHLPREIDSMRSFEKI